MKDSVLLVFLCIWFSALPPHHVCVPFAQAFVSMPPLRAVTSTAPSKAEVVSRALYAVQTAKSKKKSARKVASNAAVSLKGFGSGGSSASSSKEASSTPSATYELDRSKEALSFYDYIDKGCIGFSNLKRVALAYFPMNFGASDQETVKLRGVVALRPIKKGEVIIQIPYDMAINLGRDSAHPATAASNLLRKLCQEDASNNGGSQQLSNSKGSTNRAQAYFNMLPPYNGVDCHGSTDFFSLEALDALQFPPIYEETLARREQVKQRFIVDFEQSASNGINIENRRSLVFPDGTEVTEGHLHWAAWLVASRVLTVQGAVDDENVGFASPPSYKLLIPLIDMCNHARTSPHILTGRASKGGMLKVIAGCNVEAGEEIRICYGGGVEGNDRFIQDYGFLDSHEDAYKLVAQHLLGNGLGKKYKALERASVLERLKETTIEEDEAQLLTRELADDVRAAIQFRLGVKRALAYVGGR